MRRRPPSVRSWFEGNQRVEADDHPLIFPARDRAASFDAFQIDEGVKALFATGLFQDVRTDHAGRTADHHRHRKPGHQPHRLRGQQEGQGRAAQGRDPVKGARDAVSPRRCRRTLQRLVEVYRRSGRFDIRVDPKIIELAQQPRRSRLRNHRGRQDRRQATSNSSAIAPIRLTVSRTSSRPPRPGCSRFLQTSDIYDPDRVEADRELLRRFYLKHGYIDVRIVSAIGEYDPTRAGFVITFTIEEGEQYRVGTVDVQSNIRGARSGIAALAAADISGRRLQRRGGREDRRGHDDRGGQAGLCLRDGAPARDSRSANANGQPRLRRRRRAARLHRARSTSAAIPARATT